MGGRTWYAYRNGRRDDGCSFVITMHGEVARLVGLQILDCIDHRDGNGLNNQRHNLRPATTAQNSRNRGRCRNNTSGYKGVTWYKPQRKWLASISIDGRRKHLGYFASKLDAALAYDAAAREYHGDFARLNFPAIHDATAAVA